MRFNTRSSVLRKGRGPAGALFSVGVLQMPSGNLQGKQRTGLGWLRSTPGGPRSLRVLRAAQPSRRVRASRFNLSLVRLGKLLRPSPSTMSRVFKRDAAGRCATWFWVMGGAGQDLRRVEGVDKGTTCAGKLADGGQLQASMWQ